MPHPLTREKNPFGLPMKFLPTLSFRLLMTENGWRMPSTRDEALVLYCDLVAMHVRIEFGGNNYGQKGKLGDKAKRQQ